MTPITINGPEGRIQARYHHNEGEESPIALLLHAHPQYGGHMDNRVMQVLHKTFANLGFSALRFNFREPDREQKPSQGESELCDAAAALDWLQTQNPEAAHSWIFGVSFGSWIGMQMLMRRPEITAFVSVAPPANSYDFTFLAPCPTSGLLVYGEADEMVKTEHIDRLMAHLCRQKKITVDLEKIPKANHFFSQKEDILADIVNSYVIKRSKEIMRQS